MTDPNTAIMICGHGSRDRQAIDEFLLLADGLRKRLPHFAIESGFLEFARPVIRDGLERLKDNGARRILALPGMLFAAGHVKNDLPWEINSFAADNPQLSVVYGRDLAIDFKLVRAAAERIAQAEAAAAKVEREDTLLLVVGRGTNDPDANSNIAKVTRMLREGMGFGWADCAFSGVTTPLVDAALERLSRLGFRRILVFPYFLFTGILVKRIYQWTDEAAARHPDIDFVKAPYLADHPLVIDSFADRVGELLDGQPAMNCQLCKYREHALGYERDVGAIQTGHHHHVRGIGVDGDDRLHHHPHGHHHHGHDHHVHDHGHHRPEDKTVDEGDRERRPARR
jgi:sirohydrochlorin cobaltochelatase